MRVTCAQGLECGGDGAASTSAENVSFQLCKVSSMESCQQHKTSASCPQDTCRWVGSTCLAPSQPLDGRAATAAGCSDIISQVCKQNKNCHPDDMVMILPLDQAMKYAEGIQPACACDSDLTCFRIVDNERASNASCRSAGTNPNVYTPTCPPTLKCTPVSDADGARSTCQEP